MEIIKNMHVSLRLTRQEVEALQATSESWREQAIRAAAENGLVPRGADPAPMPRDTHFYFNIPLELGVLAAKSLGSTPFRTWVREALIQALMGWRRFCPTCQKQEGDCHCTAPALVGWRRFCPTCQKQAETCPCVNRSEP